jgi:hypothetical protein
MLVTVEPDLKLCGPRATAKELGVTLLDALAGSGAASESTVGDGDGEVPDADAGGAEATLVADTASDGAFVPATSLVALAAGGLSFPAVGGFACESDGPPASEGAPDISDNPEAGAGDGNEGKGATTVLSRV